ncbi:glycosyltransferase [Thalassotalea eurytherma]|uniref:Glycosyl transferase n=1 Tax=Thalassotalea eurytherma TaxID=1144278 RepID=A0ABQ6H108_9GAMM|nr:glycosyltransferase [Thalassotalea eurytherma]GLX81277.1 glycosyl transferase [Thalassotalea eurytherma]
MKFPTFTSLGQKEIYAAESIVAMSVYHGDKLKWIKEAVNSILEQTYRDFIFVIVIDGDVDKQTLNYLKQLCLAVDNMFAYQGVTQAGLSTCMNFAIDYGLKINARYFFRMDADDKSLPTRLEKQVNYFSEKSHVDVLGSALIEIDEQGQKVGARKFPEHHDLLVKILPLRCPLNHPTVAIRFSVFEQGFRYNPMHLNTQDYFFWVTLASAGFKLANIREPLLEYRRVQGFYKRRGKDKSINEFKARLFAMKTLKRYNIKTLTYAYFVLGLRMMPSFVIKLAYKFDRKFIHGNTDNTT